MKNEVSAEIGARIALIRKKHHMKQAELAQHLNVSPKHVSQVERGMSTFSQKTMIDFCNLFDCDMNYILMGRDAEGMLDRLPGEITDLIYTGSNADINQFNDYLRFYINLLKKQEKN